LRREAKEQKRKAIGISATPIAAIRRSDRALDFNGTLGSDTTAFGPRTVCAVCGAIGADARTNWQKRETG